ncbi:hypothetical protein AAY473_011876 [Plecturocebus cupreus]
MKSLNTTDIVKFTEGFSERRVPPPFIHSSSVLGFPDPRWKESKQIKANKDPLGSDGHSTEAPAAPTELQGTQLTIHLVRRGYGGRITGAQEFKATVSYDHEVQLAQRIRDLTLSALWSRYCASPTASATEGTGEYRWAERCKLSTQIRVTAPASPVPPVVSTDMGRSFD